MSDVYQPDPDRLLADFTFGQVQAWEPKEVAGIAVAVSFFADFKRSDTKSYSHASYYLTISDARELAEFLTKAADHAFALAVKKAEAA